MGIATLIPSYALMSSAADDAISEWEMRGEREGPDDLPEGARSTRSISGVRGEREGPSEFQEGARSPCYIRLCGCSINSW